MTIKAILHLLLQMSKRSLSAVHISCQLFFFSYVSTSSVSSSSPKIIIIKKKDRCWLWLFARAFKIDGRRGIITYYISTPWQQLGRLDGKHKHTRTCTPWCKKNNNAQISTSRSPSCLSGHRNYVLMTPKQIVWLRLPRWPYGTDFQVLRQVIADPEFQCLDASYIFFNVTQCYITSNFGSLDNIIHHS